MRAVPSQAELRNRQRREALAHSATRSAGGFRSSHRKRLLVGAVAVLVVVMMVASLAVGLLA